MRNLSQTINLMLALIFLPFCYAEAEVDSLNIKYRVIGSIPFNPVEEDTMSQTLALGNNEISEALPIGFSFRFFENTYTNFHISSNGFITFSSDGYSGCCSGQFLPDPSSPNNLIAFDWEYLLTGNNGTINYFTTGNAPNRRLVVNFVNVPTYSSNNPVTSQVVLYESTNIIEVYTTQMTNDGWPRTMGIENSNGTKAYIVPGRNSTDWAASNEGIRFEPYFQTDDAGLQVINSPQPFICTGGTLPIEITVRNFGTNILDSVRVNWMLNGVLQPPLLVQSPLYPRISGDSSTLKVTLGSLTFALGEEFSIKAWTSYPNGVMDSVNTNDTLAVIAHGALSGNFTIGGNNPDFATFADATNALTNYGICQPVVFNVRSGVYNEQVIIPAINGATGTNTVTFQSESGNAADVQLIYSANYQRNYTLLLENAGNIIVKNISIEASNEYYGRVIEIREAPYTNSFTGNRIAGIPLATNGADAAAVYWNSNNNNSGGESNSLTGLGNAFQLTPEADHSTVFSNNHITGGSYGIYQYANGESGSYNKRGARIENNQFEDQYYSAVYLSGQINARVIGNTIRSVNNQNWFYGVNVSYLNSPLEISRNKIEIINGVGVYVYGSNIPEQYPGLISNNFISVGGNNNNYGIQTVYSSQINFYHNNINNYSTASNAFSFYTYGCSGLKLYNNIFVAAGPSYAIYVGSGDISVSDYNAFYTKGVNIGYWSGKVIKGLAEWRIASSLDMHSLFADPLFVSSTDLHVNKALLNGTGISLQEVDVDIDGADRQSPPDIGADEFTPVNENAELELLEYPHLPFAPGNYPIKAVIKNSGASVLTSLDISWQVNSIAQPGFHWTGTIATGQSDTVDLGNFTFAYKASYSLKAWIGNPNNSTDIEPINDTITTDIFYPALSGTYTVGGNSPDFASFTEIADILNKGGVSGSATFNIRNGTYTEQFVLGHFPGSSCENRVTFQPESGDSTSVVLQYNSDYYNNYIIQLDGATGVVIKKLTFQALNQYYYGHLIEIKNGSGCNVISNNILQGINSPYSSVESAIIYSPSGNSELQNDNGNVFINNKFRSGSSGITWYGYSSNRETGTIVKGNVFDNQFNYAVLMQYQNSPVITSNLISTNTTNNYFYGINASYCFDSARIEKNKISIANGGYGIYITSNNGSFGNEILVANNFVSIGGSGTSYGIYSYYGNYQKIYNNSVNLTGLTSNSSAFYSYYSSNTQLRNNIFANEGTGVAINLYGFYGGSSDYNDLYSRGTYLGYMNGNNISDIASWRNISGQDNNSIFTHPLFLSATDLHVNKALLDSRGIALSEVTTDIDGEPRGELPDIGADEFTPVGSNVQFVSLQVPKAPFAPGTYPVSGRIRNVGSDTLTSVSISWQINGVAQAPYNWTGSLTTGGEDSVFLGNLSFIQGSGSNVKAWTSAPNGSTDIDTDDDTIRINNIYAALSGAYTIGGTSPDFATFEAAVKALNEGGVRSPVTFNIRNGTYAEQLSLKPFPGNGCNNPITFQAESGDSTAVVVQYDASYTNNYVLQLDGVAGVTIKKLTLKSLNYNYSRVIEIKNGAQCNVIAGNILQGVNNGSTSDISALVYSPAGNSALQNDNKNTFSNNWFRDGSYGILFSGYSSNRESGTVIEDNLFENQFYMGIWLQYQDAPMINRNTIRTNSSYSSFFGIYAYLCYNATRIQRNRIAIVNGGYGMYLNNLYGYGAEALVANNFISVGGLYTATGINNYNNSSLKVYNNSVNITSTSASGRAFYSYNSSYLQLRNNIFANTGNGYSIYFDYNNYGNSFDYNDLYSTGPYLGYLNGNRPDIATWRSASGQDINSVSSNPLFTSFSDLRVNKAVLNGRGIAVPEVTTDIDGATRGTPPDIGAYEFTAIGNNVQLIALRLPKAPFSPDTYPVSAVIKNVGADTLNSVKISWEVNGVPQPTYNWTGAIVMNGEDSVLLGNFGFNNISAFNVRAWVADPNGTVDIDPEDDTVKIGNIYPSLSGSYTIGGNAPDFSTFTNAVNVLNYGGVRGPVTFNIRNGIYTEQVVLKRFPGGSCEVPVIFQSENGDNTVTLQYNANSNNNYTLQLNGALGVTIKEIIIRSLNQDYGHVVELTGGASCNQIIGAVLQGVEPAYASISTAVVYSSDGNGVNDNCNNNAFRYNSILSGSYGIYYLGYNYSFSGRESGTLIEDNLFQAQYYQGIFLQYQQSPRISGNIINTISPRTDFYGIYTNYCYDKIRILKNSISTNGGFGIYISYAQSTDGAEGLIANNFVSVGGNSTAYGIFTSYALYQKICNNNVLITGTNISDGRAYYRASGGGDHLEILNNIFANTGGGYAFYADNIFGLTNLNNNNLYTTGTYLGYLNGNRVNLSAWKATTGMEANSISVNPDFVSATDLHVRAVNMDGKAVPLALVTDDIDGQLRSLTAPDIGADEYTTATHDAEIRAIASPAQVFPSGINQVKVVLLNNAVRNLTKATINWSVNDTLQSPYAWTGTLTPGNNIQVPIGSFNFAINSAYTIKAWTSLPNGEIDEEPANDSAKVESIYAGLGGTYTIGGDNPSFPTFNSAINAMVKGGVANAVLFKVRNGTYIEQISIPEIAGASSTNNIIFKSESGNNADVKITYGATVESKYTLQLNGADFISFRGMTLEATDASYANVLDIRNGSSNNSFTNNIFKGMNASGSDVAHAVIYSPDNAPFDNNNVFKENEIIGGSNGILLYGYLYGVSQRESGTRIENNTFTNQSYSAIQVLYQEGLLISSNKISSTTGTNFFGILAQSCNNKSRIEKNKINTKGGYGIYLYDCNGSAGNKGLVANNFIAIGGESTAYGIYFYYSNFQDVYFNTVNITSTYANVGRAFYLTGGVSQCTSKNNIFANTGGGYAVVLDDPASLVSSDYNNLYTTGGVLAYSGGDLANLSNWRNSTGKDAHSLSINPLFNSSEDLHIRETALKNAGIPIEGIVDDVDNDKRDNTPDMGADEFLPPANDDAGVVAINRPTAPFGTGSQPVVITVRNYGALPLTQVRIKWQINGAVQPDFEWTGNLASGRQDSVFLGLRNFTLVRKYDIKAWTESPNGKVDSLNYNDTSKVDNLYAALAGTYTIGGADPDFASFTEAVAALKNGGIAAEVIFNVRAGVYNERISIPQIVGTSPDRRIIFKPETGDSTSVMLTKEGIWQENYVVQLAGADYLTFEKLSFSSSSEYYARIVDLRNGSDHNIFRNNLFKGRATTYTGDGVAVIYSPAYSLNQFNQFTGNRILNGSIGIYFYGYNGSNKAQGTVIEDNILEGQLYSAINLAYLDAPVIKSNKITTTSLRDDFSAVSVYGCDHAIQIEKNKIVAVNGGFGLLIQYTNSLLGGVARIVNNTISLGGSGNAYGIRLVQATNINVLHNSINITGSHLTNGRAFSTYYGGNIQLVNNIFSNSGGGYAIYHDYMPAVSYSDYNDLYTTGAALGYGDGNQSNLQAWKNATTKDQHSFSVDPYFYSSIDLHTSQIILDSAGISVTGVIDDIDGDLRNLNKPDIGADEFKIYSNDIGISALVSPVSGCGLDSLTSITAKIINFGGNAQSHFNLAYSYNGNEIIENIGDVTILPGRKADYIFNTKLTISQTGDYSIKLYTLLNSDSRKENDTLKAVFHNYPVLQASQWNLLPQDGTVNLSKPVAFSWSSVQYAKNYDLYIWADSLQIPVTPTISDIQQISYSYEAGLKYGVKYKWKIIAKNECSVAESPVQSFRLRNLPELIVNDIQAPVSVYSGQQIQLDWEVKNIGTGGTEATTWIDAIYLSTDATLEYNLDTYLGGVANFSALASKQSYRQTALFAIPQGYSGNYYVIVQTNRYNGLLEENPNNNISIAPTVMAVNLTPPPDLRVTSVISPEIAFSSQEVDVTWKVTNAGNGDIAPTTWYDKIYLSTDEQFTGRGFDLGRFRHTGGLLSDSSYTETKTLKLPDGIFGKYYLYIQTDQSNQVYEHVFEVNNVTRSDSMRVILTPPADYVVTQVTVPTSASNKQSILVKWTVENQGGTAPDATWTDGIYLSRAASFYPDSVILVGTFGKSGTVPPTEAYIAQKEIIIPASIQGPYYVYVKTDINKNVFEYINEENNILRSTNPLLTLQPDLITSAISTGTPANSGRPLQISWITKNGGNGILYSTKWVDRIYISAAAQFNLLTAVKLDSLEYTATLNPGDTLSKQKSVILPNGISGNRYIFVLTDFSNKVFEGAGEGNNTGRSEAFPVSLSPWADLRVVSVESGDTLQAGANVSVKFTVINKGLAPTALSSWKDRIYISPDSIFNANAIVLGDWSTSNLLKADSSYISVATLPIPPQLRKGAYYVHVFADGNNVIYEHTAENNNSRAGKAIYVKSYPPLDLKVNAAIVSGSANSGKPVKISWSVNNIGLAPTFAPKWLDGIYLSKDAVWSQSDKLIGEFQKEGPLKAGSGYSNSQNVTIPNGISGSYFVLIVSDHTRLNNDVDYSNNVFAAVDTTQGPGPINIILTPPSDLIVSSFNAPAEGTSGQPVTISWTIKNQGIGATAKASWTDKVYLSTDNEIDNYDRVLGTVVRTGNLAGGASYSESLEVSLPISAAGNFILLLKTDNNDAEYEHEAENNNVRASLIKVTRPPLSDLIVSNVEVPAEAEAAAPVVLNWTIKNLGSNPASGVMKEALYFSADSVWDINDVVVGTYDINFNIAPLGEKKRNVTAEIPGLPLGKYFLIVKTDILNNIYESNDSNNVAHSEELIDISVRTLPVNVLTTTTLQNQKPVYYKIEVPENLVGESLIVLLKGDSVNGSNEIYLRHDQMPTRAEYDFAQENPFQGNQEIIISTLQAGVYYMLVYGSTSGGTSQQIKLLARKLSFEIRSVSAVRGGNTGKVTLQINGSKFIASMKTWLKKSNEIIPADTVWYINPTRMFATFDLSGAGLGKYDILAENDSYDTARLAEGFEVVKGISPQLLTNVLAPASTRPSTIVALTIQFSNAGNTDIINPVVEFNSAGGAPVGFTVGELSQNKKTLKIPLRELNGPEGVLRPGVIGSVVIYSISTSGLGFVITLPKLTHEEQ